MAVGLAPLPEFHGINGVRIGVASAGVKRPGKRDNVLFELEEGTQTAGVFTKNAFCAAPVVLAKASLSAARPRYLLINTGNANAGTGEAGMIRPNMATMLAYVATDASIEPGLLQCLVRDRANASFNRITIDGDTSTNDACLLIATGKSAAPAFSQDNEALWAPSYTEELGLAEMNKEEICVRVELNRGDVSEEIWTTDSSHEYVRINAEYRT